MKIFLIIYGILALIFYIWLLVGATKKVEKTNRMFIRPVAHVSIYKLLFSSLLFPLIIIYSVVTAIIKRKEQGGIKWRL